MDVVWVVVLAWLALNFMAVIVLLVGRRRSHGPPRIEADQRSVIRSSGS
jgi:hypothetical protein